MLSTPLNCRTKSWQHWKQLVLIYENRHQVFCWPIAFQFLRNFRRNDNQQQRVHTQNPWNKVEPRSRSFYLHSLPGQRFSQHKEENIIGSHKILWTTRMIVTNYSSVEILLANTLDGQDDLAWNLIVKHPRTIRKISTLTQRTGKDQTWTRSFCSTFFVIFGASCVLWRVNLSVCRSCLRARANGRPSAHTNACSQNTRCPNQNFMCPTFRTLCSTIISSSERSHQWQPFSQPQSLCLDRFTCDPRWIIDIPRKLKTFVANRVAKIQSIIPSDNWKFVPTEDNPADGTSRGISAEKFLNLQLWWKGPNWLRQEEQFGPSMDVTPLCNASTDDLAELYSSAQLFLVMQHQHQDNRILDFISRQSSMYRLVRVFAYVKLFTQRLQSRIKRRSSNNHSQSLTAIDHSNT